MARTSKGHIQQLPSGSFRVKVYAGTDPVASKQRLLRQTCPGEASAHVALGQLLAETDGGISYGVWSGAGQAQRDQGVRAVSASGLFHVRHAVAVLW